MTIYEKDFQNGDKKLVCSYVGTAEHLYWLVSFKRHPKQTSLDFLGMAKVNEDFDYANKGVLTLNEQMSEEAQRDEQRVKENEEFLKS